MVNSIYQEFYFLNSTFHTHAHLTNIIIMGGRVNICETDFEILNIESRGI